MSHEISRMFPSAGAANKAAAELKEEGFTDVHVVTSPTANDVPLSAIAAQIALGKVALADAKIYAKGVSEGGSLVTVHAPFATGRLAEHVLASHGPIPSGMPEAEEPRMWDEAAPLSSALVMPVLDNNPTPMSKIMGLSTLTSPGFSLSGMLGMPLVTDGAMGDTGRLGLKYLMNNPAPLSSMLGLPLLKESRPKQF